jgi:hypothetical protein
VQEERLAISKLGDSDASLSRHRQFQLIPELQHVLLFDVLSAIKGALNCTMDKSTPIRREMLCWAVASFSLTDADRLDTSISILLKSGRLPKDIGEQTQVPLSEGPEYSRVLGMYGRGMLEFLVIPYLRGDIVQ